MDGRWPALGAVRLEHTGDSSRRDQPPRELGPEVAAAPGKGDGDMSRERRALLTVLR